MFVGKFIRNEKKWSIIIWVLVTDRCNEVENTLIDIRHRFLFWSYVKTVFYLFAKFELHKPRTTKEISLHKLNR